MELLITDKDWIELGYFEDTAEADIEVGDSNDFELILPKIIAKKYEIAEKCIVFVPGTEFGGLIEDTESITSGENITFRGGAWRKYLEQLIIEPPSGQSYLTVSGDANRILKQVLNKGAGLLFEVPDYTAGINISKHQFRYIDALTGLTDMLEKQNARLDIKAVQGETGEPCRIVIQAVRRKNYSEELEYNGDDNIDVTTRACNGRINHLICLGKGELANRIVVHLYAQLDGTVGTKQYYKGTEERTAIYDYSSGEKEDLVKEGTKKLKELMNYKEAKMTISAVNLEIGDIVSARDREAGILLSRPVARKILHCENGEMSVEYKLKGEQ